MKTRLACLLTSALACGALACSGSAGPGDGAEAGNDAVTNDVIDSDGGMDAHSDAHPDVQQPDVQPDGPIVPPRGGQITASVISLPMQAQSIGAAAFWSIMGENPSDRCHQRIDGACTIINCRTRGGGGDAGTDAGTRDGGTGTRPHAGDITISGGTGMPMVLSPDTNGNYQPVQERGEKWHMGDMLTFSAAGGGPDGVPPFTASLTFPTPAMVTEPMPMTVFSIPLVQIDHTQPFTARWTPGTGGITIFIGQGGFGGMMSLQSGVTINCVYPSSAGTGTVPASALSDLMSTTGSIPDAFLAVTARVSVEVSAGEYRITVNATGGGLVAAAEIR